jgi:hypothetical protein
METAAEAHRIQMRSLHERRQDELVSAHQEQLRSARVEAMAERQALQVEHAEQLGAARSRHAVYAPAPPPPRPLLIYWCASARMLARVLCALLIGTVQS